MKDTIRCPRCNTQKPREEFSVEGYVCQACREKYSGTVDPPIPVIDLTSRSLGTIVSYAPHVTTFSIQINMENGKTRPNVVYGSSEWLCRQTSENMDRLAELDVLEQQAEEIKKLISAKHKEFTDFINTYTFREINDERKET